MPVHSTSFLFFPTFFTRIRWGVTQTVIWDWTYPSLATCRFRMAGDYPAGSPSRGRDVTVYVWHEPTELAHSFFFCSCVYFCLFGPFNCIPCHKFSQQPSGFSPCSSSQISVLLVFSTVYSFTKVSLSPDIILCGWLTNDVNKRCAKLCLNSADVTCIGPRERNSAGRLWNSWLFPECK